MSPMPSDPSRRTTARVVPVNAWGEELRCSFVRERA
jgi:hypothetical protein